MANLSAKKLDNLITVREAARECHRTTETIRRWVWEGKIPAQKIGNQLFIKRRDLARLAVSARQRNAADDELAVLERIRTVRERIARRIGAIDVLEALDRSREGHP